MMAQALAVGGLTFLVTVSLGRPFIALMRSRGIGKAIRAEGPGSHAAKAGTPTMGGLLILASVLLMTVAFGQPGGGSLLLISAMIGFGLIGAMDDLMGLAGEGTGMKARFKFAGLVAMGLALALVLHYGFLLQSVVIPFLGQYSLGLWYLPVAILAIVGTANGVNLTDGLDALAGGTVALAFAAYGVIAFLQELSWLAGFCFIVVGAMVGFLWYNVHPAQLFMGDTGSLALGGTLALVALVTERWLLLPLIGIIFVVETASVLVQVAYFKLSGGRRIFRMSPLHHHFELMGWTEPQVTMRFWLVGVLGAMLGIALALV